MILLKNNLYKILVSAVKKLNLRMQRKSDIYILQINNIWSKY